MRFLLFAAALSTAACGTVGGPISATGLAEAARASRSAPPKRVNRLGEVTRLPSGLRLAAYQVEGQRDVTVRLVVQAGVAYEPADRPGLAELATLALRRARRGPDGVPVERRLATLGALVSVSELPDELAFEVRCQPGRVTEVVALLSEVVDHPEAAVTDEDVEAARASLARMLGTGLARVASQGRDAAARALAGTRYARPIPTVQALRALGPEEVRRYLGAALTPQRTVIVLIGGAPHREQLAAARQALPATVAAGPAEGLEPLAVPSEVALAPHPTDALEVVHVPSGVPTLWLAWPAPGVDANAELAVRSVRRAVTEALQGTVLGSGAPWRALGFAVQVHQWDAAAVVLVAVPLASPADAEPLRAALTGRARARLRPGTVPSLVPRYSADDIYRVAAAGRFDGQARCIRVTGRTDALGWQWDQARAFERRWAELLDRWMAPGPSAAVLFQPDGTSATLPWPALHEDQWGALEGEEDEPPGTDAILRLVEPPGLAAAHREPLPGGAELVVLPRPGLPTVWGRVLLPGGGISAAEEPAARNALEQAEVALRRDRLCVDVATATPAAGLTRIEDMRGTAQLPLLIESLGCWSRARPEVPLRPLESPRRSALLSAVQEALSTGGPLLHPDALPAPDGTRYLRRTLQSRGATVLLVGDLEVTASLSAMVRAGFAGWAPQPDGAPAPAPAPTSTQPATPPAPWPEVRRTVVVEGPAGPGAVATILLREPATSDRKLAQEQVAVEVLGRRLSHAAAAFGVLAVTERSETGAARNVVVRLAGEARRLPAALQVVLAEVKELADSGPGADETARARWKVAREAAYRHDTSAAALEGLAIIAQRGLAPDAFERFPAELAATGPGEVRDAIRALAIGRESILVIGDPATLGPALLEEAGLAWEPWPAAGP